MQVDYTDGSYWQCLGSCSNWDGSEWVEAGPGMSLQTEAESTWADGFRPTKVRVTFTASVGTIGVGELAGGNDYGSGQVASGAELDLTVTYDIERINLYLTNSVSKIEFYVDSAGTDSDGDGVNDDVDDCLDSDLSETVVIDECDSGVENTLLANGCTIADLINQCMEGAVNHGQFVSCATAVTNGLKAAGVISGNQKGKIQKCATKADIF